MKKSTQKSPKKISTSSRGHNKVILALFALVAFAFIYRAFAPSFTPQTPDIDVITPTSLETNGSYAIEVVSPTNNPGILDLDFADTYKVVLNGGQTAGVDNKIVGASIELLYNPTLLEITDILSGGQLTDIFLPNLISGPTITTVSTTSKKITLNLTNPPSAEGKTGSGVVMTFKVKPLKASSSTVIPAIDFGPTSSIRAVNVSGADGNVLKTAPKYIFTVNPRFISDIVFGYDSAGNSLNTRTDKVNEKDYMLYVANFGKAVTAGTKGDFNKNGKVDIADYPIFVREYAY